MHVAIVGRAATGSLLLGGAVLALLMGYILIADFGNVRAPGNSADDVAVFLPSQGAWFDFRRAAQVCVGRGLATLIDTTPDAIVLRTPRHRRLVRFTWHGVQGETETRQEVRRLVDRDRPPLAVIGSSNTALTLVLAAALAEAGTPERPAPVLLTTEATADRVDAAEAVDLLSIHRGRSFRLGLANRRQADLLIRYLTDRDGAASLDRAFIVVDRNDPYSDDLAQAFLSALEAAAPEVAVARDSDVLDLGRSAVTSSDRERAWARRVWNAVEEAGTDRHVLVLLPLQEQPARRLLGALQGYGPASPGGDGSSPRVLIGDGVGRDTLLQFAGPLLFPVWCPSSTSVPAEEARGVPPEPGVQIPAEAISALLTCLDVPEGRQTDLAGALHALDLPADDPRAMGRRLAFDAQGERRGPNLGTVLGIEPGDPAVSAYESSADGDWIAHRWDGRFWRAPTAAESAASPVVSRP